MSKKKVLLLGASALQLAAIRKTKELGLPVLQWIMMRMQ